MENYIEDVVAIQEMELLEANYEVFMKWSQPSSTWNTVLYKCIKLAIVR